jgi:Pyridine nucleotide-disulphide oxidoreductase
MPRHALLGYMRGRVVKNCPTFFEKYVQFNQSVSKVYYDQNTKQFSITVRDMLSGTTSTQFFDKCIWAAGDNGMPFIPQSLLRILHDFRGKIWHSSDANSFEDDVRGKQVLLVGGSYSAEDLALMACKIGVKRVYIVSRSEDNVVTWTNKWPENRVKCLNGFSPIKVVNGTQIVLRRTKYVAYDTYEVMQGDEVVIKNIDTIILCTGYYGQFGMLEPNLCGWACDSEKSQKSFPVPDDWEMSPNPISKNIGNVPHPREGRWCGSLVVHPELYRGILIENPSMMFLRHEHEDYPILGIDAQAWLLMQFLTGGREIPSKVEMQKQNLEQALHEMKPFPYCRYPTFFKLWTEDVDPDWELYNEAEATRNKYDFMVMARTLREADHPLDIGTINGLNTLGQTLHEYGQMDYDGRQSTTTHTTFRDIQDVEEFKSIFTGTSSVPLKKPWLEIREIEEDDYF